MRIFVAGATGLIGARLVRLLTDAGHQVAGMTRSPGRAGPLRDLGVEAVICDVFDLPALTAAVTAFGPDVVFHQLTDLPDDAGAVAAYGERNNRIRTEGTGNLLAASAAAGARVIAQSVSWELPSGSGRTAVGTHERSVLMAGGVVIRYGQFHGPGTYYPSTPPPPPRIDIDEAARRTLSALDVPPGVTIVIDDRAAEPAT